MARGRAAIPDVAFGKYEKQRVAGPSWRGRRSIAAQVPDGRREQLVQGLLLGHSNQFDRDRFAGQSVGVEDSGRALLLPHLEDVAYRHVGSRDRHAAISKLDSRLRMNVWGQAEDGQPRERQPRQ